jgi:hypothetical protein
MTPDIMRVRAYFAERGLPEQIDKTHRRRGPLWVVTDRCDPEHTRIFDYCDDEWGTYFLFAEKGSRTTCGRAGWFWVPGHIPGLWLCPGVLEEH